MTLEGKVFGRLLVGKYSGGKSKAGAHLWECKCSCGNKTLATTSNLISGNTSSCGCLRLERLRAKTTKHGLSSHPLYTVWQHMVYRCSPRAHKFSARTYILKQIKVCEEWKHTPEKFISWALAAGWKPELEIDRANNDGNYEPGNCRFVTKVVNCSNRGKTSVDSGFTGVYEITHKKHTNWNAKIWDRGTVRWDKRFATAEEAAVARHRTLTEEYPWKKTDPAVEDLLC